MKHILTLSFLSVLTFSVFAQDPCNDLSFVSIKYSAFTDTTIIVHVENAGSEIFSYPGFVLIDSNGDTLAKEQVNLFGIGGESVHSLDVRPNVLDPQNNFQGNLELHTGFYDVLECSWPLNQSLCSDQPCDSLVIGFENWGGALVVGDFEWTVRDASNAVIETGQFTMEVNPQHWQYTLCLEPGEYTYSLEALTSPSGGGPTLTARAGTSFGYPSVNTYLDWWNDPISTLEIPFYPFCAEAPNGIFGDEDQGIMAFYDMASKTLTCSQKMNVLTLYNSHGQVVSQFNPNSTIVSIPDLSAGTYIAVIETEKGEVRSKLFHQ